MASSLQATILFCCVTNDLEEKLRKKKKDHDCKVVQVTNTKEAVDYQEERPLRASCLSVHQSVSPCSASAQGGKKLDSTWEDLLWKPFLKILE